MQSGCNFTTV